MKEATIQLAIAKDHHVRKTGVTPLEAMLLVAQFNALVGGNPVEIIEQHDIPTSIKVPKTRDRLVTNILGKGPDGKDVVESRNIPEHYDEVVKIAERTPNDEWIRVTQKYGKAKVKALRESCAEIPKDFDEAFRLGLATNVAGEKLIGVSDEQVKTAALAVGKT